MGRSENIFHVIFWKQKSRKSFYLFVCFVTGKQTTGMQNKYIIKVLPTYLPIFLKPFQPKAFVSMWGQHWPFNSVYMMTRKKKSLVEEGLNSEELSQDVLSSSNPRFFCRQQHWQGTCRAVTGPGETQGHWHLSQESEQRDSACPVPEQDLRA